MTLSALLASLRKSLRSFGVVNPDVEAETIISHILGMKRSRIYLDPDREITASEREQIDAIVRERARRFPLQYLIGEVEFMGLPFRIKEGVFVPRPETEILVEAVLARAGSPGPGTKSEPATASSSAAGPPRDLRILDLATGSGVIAISLAKYLRPAFVLAVDISEAAVSLARDNARLNRVEDVIRFAVGDGLAPITPADASAGFDLVVSNPPYIETGDLAALQPEVRDYEPRAALDGGPNGLKFIREVAPGIPSILRRPGIVAFEIGSTQGERAKSVFRQIGLSEVEVLQDLAGRDRVVIGVA